MPVRPPTADNEPPAKRRKLSPSHPSDALVSSQPTQTPTNSQNQSQKKSLPQPSSQPQSSFADVLARLKESASESRGTCLAISNYLVSTRILHTSRRVCSKLSIAYASKHAHFATSIITDHHCLPIRGRRRRGQLGTSRPAKT